MIDDNTQALAAVRRSARAAERRLGATEAEMRFASDIAAGIYTTDMIPAVMDADKITELADCYIAEMAFEDVDARPQSGHYSPQKDAPVVSSGVSIPGMQENEPLDRVAQMHASILSSSKDMDASTSHAAPNKVSLFRRFLSWVPSICVLIFFVALCAYIYNPSIFSFGNPSSPTKSASADLPSHAVDYKTRYVGSVNSSFIHLSTCRHADNIQEENRVYYESIADALADGRSKCSTCLSGTSSTSSGGGGTPIPIAPPENGEILKDTQEEKLAPLTVKTLGSSDYYIALKCIDVPDEQFSSSFVREYDNLRHDMAFYVRGGKTAEILVPLAEYELYYAVGDTWYGGISKFGEGTRYYKCEDTFLFEEQWDDEGMYYSGWTITLYAVPGGNMASDEISADEFPLL